MTDVNEVLTNVTSRSSVNITEIKQGLVKLDNILSQLKTSRNNLIDALVNDAAEAINFWQTKIKELKGSLIVLLTSFNVAISAQEKTIASLSLLTGAYKNIDAELTNAVTTKKYREWPSKWGSKRDRLNLTGSNVNIDTGYGVLPTLPPDYGFGEGQTTGGEYTSNNLFNDGWLISSDMPTPAASLDTSQAAVPTTTQAANVANKIEEKYGSTPEYYKDAKTESTRLTKEEAKAYRGFQTKASDGKTCINWGSSPMARYAREAQNNQYGLSTNHNFCRNSDDDATIWCWTSENLNDPSGRSWGYCNWEDETKLKKCKATIKDYINRYWDFNTKDLGGCEVLDKEYTWATRQDFIKKYGLD